MKRVAAAAVLFILVACGRIPISTLPHVKALDYSARPELKDAESQAILERYGQDLGLHLALKESYSEHPEDFLPPRPSWTDFNVVKDRLSYIKYVAWGPINIYNSEYASYLSGSVRYQDLDWSNDGCSAPYGLGLGHSDVFRPACNLHDFGYRNLKVYERTDQNRLTTDDVFFTNMKEICIKKGLTERPPCYAAAYSYYKAVRLIGGLHF